MNDDSTAPLTEDEAIAYAIALLIRVHAERPEIPGAVQAPTQHTAL
jgi:hypothetical protein